MCLASLRFQLSFDILPRVRVRVQVQVQVQVIMITTRNIEGLSDNWCKRKVLACENG